MGGKLSVIHQVSFPKGFGPFLIGSSGEVEFVITPNTARSHVGKHVIEVHIVQPVFVRFIHESLHQAVRLEPALGGTVGGVVVEDAVEIDSCLWAALVDALHDALDVGKHLRRLEVQSAAGGDVVCANHHEELLRFVDEIALEIVTLFGRVGAGVSAVHNRERSCLVAAEHLDPGCHVCDAVAHKHDASFSRGKHFEEVVPVLAEGFIGPNSANAHPKCKQQGKEGNFLHSIY